MSSLALPKELLTLLVASDRKSSTVLVAPAWPATLCEQLRAAGKIAGVVGRNLYIAGELRSLPDIRCGCHGKQAIFGVLRYR